MSGKRLKPYQQARINSFINPDTDPKGSGYQIRQSLIAVGSGGLWGKGTNKGTQTQGDFLPIPYTDFIFAAFCEEHGFVGGIGILLLYFLILTRLIQNAQTASDMPGTFIIMGVVAVILFQIVVNIGMVVGLMPVTGIPLPLMSYGGSSDPLHLPRPRHRHEHPHAPLRELKQTGKIYGYRDGFLGSNLTKKFWGERGAFFCCFPGVFEGGSGNSCVF